MPQTRNLNKTDGRGLEEHARGEGCGAPLELEPEGRTGCAALRVRHCTMDLFRDVGNLLAILNPDVEDGSERASECAQESEFREWHDTPRIHPALVTPTVAPEHRSEHGRGNITDWVVNQSPSLGCTDSRLDSSDDPDRSSFAGWMKHQPLHFPSPSLLQGGRVVVQVLAAENLPQLTKDPCNAYARVQYGRFQTRTAAICSISPTWDEQFAFDFIPEHDILVRLSHESLQDRTGLELGYVKVLQGNIRKNSADLGTWFPLARQTPLNIEHNLSHTCPKVKLRVAFSGCDSGTEVWQTRSGQINRAASPTLRQLNQVASPVRSPTAFMFCPDIGHINTIAEESPRVMEPISSAINKSPGNPVFSIVPVVENTSHFMRAHVELQVSDWPESTTDVSPTSSQTVCDVEDISRYRQSLQTQPKSTPTRTTLSQSVPTRSLPLPPSPTRKTMSRQSIPIRTLPAPPRSPLAPVLTHMASPCACDVEDEQVATRLQEMSRDHSKSSTRRLYAQASDHASNAVSALTCTSERVVKRMESARRRAPQAVRTQNVNGEFEYCSHCRQLAPEIFLRCGKCRSEKYCSTDCVEAAWASGHSQKCKGELLVPPTTDSDICKPNNVLQLPPTPASVASTFDGYLSPFQSDGSSGESRSADADAPILVSNGSTPLLFYPREKQQFSSIPRVLAVKVVDERKFSSDTVVETNSNVETQANRNHVMM